MELSKKDKQAARAIIDKGLVQEFAHAMKDAAAIIGEWQSGGLPDREAYHKLYQHVRNRDKEIAHWYDGLKNSSLMYTVLHQYREGYITDDDLAGLSDESRAIISNFAGWEEEEREESAE